MLLYISVGLGVYTLLSYKKGILTYLNALMFLLCSLRASIEYGIQNTDNYDLVLMLYRFNGITAHLFFVATWTILYYYILPFKNFKYHRLIGQVIGYCVIWIPSIIIVYLMYSLRLWEFSDHRIDGYWMFREKDSLYRTIYFYYSRVGMIGLFTSSLMIYSILTESKNRVNKIFLLIFIYVLTGAVVSNWGGVNNGEWKVTPFAYKMLFDSLIISWFISGYRLMNDHYEDASREVLNSLSELVIRTNNEFTIINMNTAASKLLGDDQKQLPVLLRNRGVDGGEEELRSILTESSSRLNLEFTNIEGNNSHMVVRASPYRWRSQDIGYSFIFTDVTDLKEKEKLLAESNITKDRLFTIIAHDLSKPAIAFRGIIQKVNYLIHKRDFDSLNKMSDSIEQSAVSLSNLLDNLLSWSLTQKDQTKVRRREVNIIHIVDEVMNNVRISRQEKSITIDKSLVDQEHSLYTDPDILQTVIRNIVDNAIKFSPIDSTVIISSHLSDGILSLKIKDEGVGMDPLQKDKLHEFYLDKSTRGTGGERGNGIGLNLVFTLVEKTQGEISVISEVGMGTEFKLTYPVDG